jgi:hypothetical protein
MIYGFDTKVRGNSSTRDLAALAEELRLSLDLLDDNSADQKTGQAPAIYPPQAMHILPLR